MSLPQSHGDLHRVFPPEVRNQIYEYVLLGKAFIVAGEHLGIGFDSEDYEAPETKFADMAILRSSKIIYQEAKSVLYKKGLFRIYLNFSKWDFEPLKIPTQERADLIENIEIIIDMESWDVHIGNWEELDLNLILVSDNLGAVVKRFSTLQVLRNVCYIRFSKFSGDFPHDVLDTSVVDMVFRQLVGFKSLIFQVEALFPLQQDFMESSKCDEKEAWEVIHNASSCKIGSKGKIVSPDAKEWLIDHKDEKAVEVIDQAQEFCTTIRDNYHDYFGEPSETDIQLHAHKHLFFGRVVFHPLQSLINRMREQATLMLGEVSTLELGKPLVDGQKRSDKIYYSVYQKCRQKS